MVGELLWLMFAGAFSGGKAIINAFDKPEPTPYFQAQQYYKEKYTNKGITIINKPYEENKIEWEVRKDLKYKYNYLSPEVKIRLAQKCREQGFLSRSEYDHYRRQMNRALHGIPVHLLKEYDPFQYTQQEN